MNNSSVMYWSPEGKPITAREFVERMFDDLPHFFDNEDQLRAIWSDLTTRENLLNDLAEAGYDNEKLDNMKDLIDARDSDVYDVLAYVAYALKHSPETNVRKMRGLASIRITATTNSVNLSISFSTAMSTMASTNWHWKK